MKTLPAQGTLYQTVDGIHLGQAITAAQAMVSHLQNKVIYLPPPAMTGSPLTSFLFAMSDGMDISNNAAITLNVTIAASPPIDYQDWAISKGLTGLNNGLSDDPNRDGRPNIMHFGFDINPLGNGSDEGKHREVFSSVSGSAYYTLTVPIRSGASFSPDAHGQQAANIGGFTYLIQVTPDLANFTLSEVGQIIPATEAGLPPSPPATATEPSAWLAPLHSSHKAISAQRQRHRNKVDTWIVSNKCKAPSIMVRAQECYYTWGTEVSENAALCK